MRITITIICKYIFIEYVGITMWYGLFFSLIFCSFVSAMDELVYQPESLKELCSVTVAHSIHSEIKKYEYESVWKNELAIKARLAEIPQTVGILVADKLMCRFNHSKDILSENLFIEEKKIAV